MEARKAVVRRPCLWKRRPSPITRLYRPMAVSARAERGAARADDIKGVLDELVE
jgi:hypothetical protein